MQENLTQAQNATGAGPGRADSAPAQHTAQGETAPHAEQTFDRAQVQREIDRVAKRERERGKRQALREMQKAQEAKDSQSRCIGKLCTWTGMRTKTHREIVQRQARQKKMHKNTVQKRRMNRGMHKKIVQTKSQTAKMHSKIVHSRMTRRAG